MTGRRSELVRGEEGDRGREGDTERECVCVCLLERDGDIQVENLKEMCGFE